MILQTGHALVQTIQNAKAELASHFLIELDELVEVHAIDVQMKDGIHDGIDLLLIHFLT